jgi:antitoxin Phd
MPQVWQLQEAKNKFSQVVNDALHHGPQVITKHGVETAVLLSYADYQQITVQQQQKLSEFFRNSPLVGVELELTRDKSPIRRETDL